MTSSNKSSRRFPVGLDQLQNRGPASAPRVVAAPTRTLVPRGSASLRLRMVARLAETPMGPGQDRVLEAMRGMPREAFVDSGLAAQAYEDTALPIGHAQTISKPSIVARMLTLAMQGQNALRQGHLGRTLEIGTGCGYQAALLSLLGPSVFSIERVAALHEVARLNLERVNEVKRTSLRLVLGDGRLGHPPNAPYDTIISAASGEAVPQAWTDQLALGGRLVAPVSRQGGRGDARQDAQVLMVIDKTEAGLVHRPHEAVCFVPLESGIVRTSK